MAGIPERMGCGEDSYPDQPASWHVISAEHKIPCQYKLINAQELIIDKHT
jgi:hypothetical protein